MQPYHTLKGARSLLPSLFKVCGNSDANLSVPKAKCHEFPKPKTSEFRGGPWALWVRVRVRV